PIRGGRFYARSQALAFSPDGKLLASTGVDSTVTLWEIATGHAWRELAMPQNMPVRDLAFAPDGRSLAIDLGDNRIRVWETATGNERRQYVGKGEQPSNPQPLGRGGFISSS